MVVYEEPVIVERRSTHRQQLKQLNRLKRRRLDSVAEPLR
jgi:hypothetical protein